VRVVHVATSAIHGGAGRAARRLHEAMRSEGIDSHLVTGDDPTVLASETIPAATGVPGGLRFRGRVERARTMWSARSRGRVFTSGLHRSGRLERIVSNLTPDVINLHWTGAGFVGTRDLPSLSAPVVWTMCDMWPITGGCHYAGACKRYAQACGDCPILGHRSDRDLSDRAWQAKAAAYEQLLDLAFVAKSSWMMHAAECSSLVGRHKVYRIPNGLDTATWTPLDQRESRRKLGLESIQPTVAFVADSVLDPRKGFDLAVESVRIMQERTGPINLLVVGMGDAREIRQSHEIPDTTRLVALGKVHETEILRTVYSYADLTLLTSREENLANVALESLACSTPVLAFAIGGNADIVTPGVSGWLSPAFDTSDLASNALPFIGNRSARDSARRDVVARFSWGSVVKAYLSVYHDLVAP
jgi:glycosyltransferase involved in cell wall biosynthesis